MREIVIHKVKVENYKAPLDIDPFQNYKIGKYLEIQFEVKSYVGFRTKTEHIGQYSYKIPPKPNRPICKMSYDELEDMAYSVIKKEFDREI